MKAGKASMAVLAFVAVYDTGLYVLWPSWPLSQCMILDALGWPTGDSTHAYPWVANWGFEPMRTPQTYALIAKAKASVTALC